MTIPLRCASKELRNSASEPRACASRPALSGESSSPRRLQTIAYASLELAKQDRDDSPPMYEKTAGPILEFADDLRQAYEAAVEWSKERA